MEGRIITISRQCGSGGHSIGSELAKRLDVPFYDKEIIEMAAKESGFHREFVKEKGEHMNSSLLFNIARYASYGGRGRYEEYQPLQDQLYFAQVKVIKELAGKGPCVIVGRCADYVLRDRKDVLNAGPRAIVERGDHESLLAKKGMYYQLYTGKLEQE